MESEADDEMKRSFFSRRGLDEILCCCLQKMQNLRVILEKIRTLLGEL